MLAIKCCPLCRQRVKVDETVKAGRFTCPRCQTKVRYKRRIVKDIERLIMRVRTPEDIDVIQRRYCV